MLLEEVQGGDPTSACVCIKDIEKGSTVRVFGSKENDDGLTFGKRLTYKKPGEHGSQKGPPFCAIW